MYQPGKVAILAKNNTDYKGNTSVEFTVADLNVKSSETDNSWYVEAAIPFTSIGATTGTHVYIAISTPTTIDPAVTGNQATNNSWTYPKLSTITIPPTPPATESKESPSWPYKVWDTENDIDITFADIKLDIVKEEPEEPDWTDITGEKIADPQYELALTTSPDKYKPGETIKVSVTIKNIKPTEGISLIYFKLFYDKDKVEPVVKNDGSINKDMEDFLIKCPELALWKEHTICKLVEADGSYEISYSNPGNSGLAKEDGSIVIEIPFKVKEDAKKTIAFQIPHGETGTYATDIKVETITGNGGYVLATLAPVTPPSSSSSSSTSSTSSEKPKTGDNGIFAIAIIAMMALAGAATIAVKKRNR